MVDRWGCDRWGVGFELTQGHYELAIALRQGQAE